MKKYLLYAIAALIIAGCASSPASGAPPSPPPRDAASAPAASVPEAAPPQVKNDLLPNGWSTDIFSVAGFDREGPGDFGCRALLSDGELQALPDLLDLASWQQLADPPEYGLTTALLLAGPDLERVMCVMDGGGGKAVIKLSVGDTGESFVYSASGQCLSQAKELAAKLQGRSSAYLAAEIVYPDTAPDKLKASPHYKQALARPSVILFNGENTTGRAPVDAFLQAVENNGDAELYLYDFGMHDVSGNGDRPELYFARFVSKGGAVAGYHSHAYSWEQELDLSPFNIEQIYLSNYGYLVWQDGASSGPNSRKVISDRDIFPDAAERQRLYDTYIRPIYYEELGRKHTWAEPAGLNWIVLYEDIYRYENGSSPFDIYGGDWPVDEMVSLLGRYFDGVTPQMVIESLPAENYNPETDTVFYMGGRGGGPFCLRVNGWRQDGDTLAISYEEYDFYTGIPRQDEDYMLTVRLMADGSFRYLSNLPAGAAPLGAGGGAGAEPPLADPFEGVAEDEPPAPPSPEQGAPAGQSGEARDFWTIREEMAQSAAAFKEANPDTIGWLYIYDTTIDSPVLQREGDNDYYLTHDDYQQYDKNGALFADFRDRFTGRDSQSLNLVLYGHSKDEDPDGGVESSRELEHFTEIKRYQDKAFCEKNPYFLFATPDESMVFEVFAAFHTKTEFVYNSPNPSRAQQQAILDEALKKSLFDFGVDISPDDRIMTLSTCCRRIVPTYPNGYRFVVMGRLVEKGKLLEYDRAVAENPTALTPDNIYE